MEIIVYPQPFQLDSGLSLRLLKIELMNVFNFLLILAN